MENYVGCYILLIMCSYYLFSHLRVTFLAGMQKRPGDVADYADVWKFVQFVSHLQRNEFLVRYNNYQLLVMEINY